MRELFSVIKPYNRLGISGIEIAIRNLVREANINKVHPHKFRRTMATMGLLIKVCQLNKYKNY